MEVILLQKKSNDFGTLAFTRVSKTEAQVHHFSKSGDLSCSNSIVGTQLELDAIERFISQMYSSEPEFIDLVPVLSLANTVKVPEAPHSEVRPIAAKNALAAPNKALG